MRGINAVAATTDGKGHLFVYDKNISSVIVFNGNCQKLYVFNVEELGIGDLKCMRWCEKTISLIIKHTFRLKKMCSDDDDDNDVSVDDESSDGDGDSDDDDDSSVHSSSDEFDSVDDESDNGNNNDDSGNNKNDHNSRTVDNKDIEKDKKEIITVVKTFFSQRKMCLPQQV